MKSGLELGRFSSLSDYTRMYALFNMGGIYLDVDIEMLGSFDSLLDRKCFLGFQNSRVVNGAVLGAVPNHPFILACFELLTSRYETPPRDACKGGPTIITEVLRQMGLGDYQDEEIQVGDVSVFPTRYFYPYYWNESYQSRCIKDDTFCVHHWTHLW